MKRILGLIFFSLALVSLPSYVLAGEENELPENCVCREKEGRIVVEFEGFLVANKSEEKAKTGPVAANLPAGTYRVWLSSFDNHLDKLHQIQPQESWFVILQNENGEVIATTSPIVDLPQDEERLEEVVNEELVLGEEARFLIAKHAAFPSDNPNSINPVCAAFEIQEEEPPPPPENHLPVFTGPSQATTTLGNTLEFTVTASDPDDDPLIFSSELPEGANWATSTGLFAWTPQATSSLGTTTARFFASDGIGTSTHEVLLEVLEPEATTTPNLPPFFVNFAPPTSATSTELYSYDVEAADPENAPLSFALDASSSPVGMNITSSTGLITWTPTIGEASSTPYQVAISVTDGVNIATTSYELLVASTTPQATTTPESNPPPSSDSGGSGGGGGSTSLTTSGGGGGPPFPIRAHNLPEPRFIGSTTTPATTTVVMAPVVIPPRAISAPISDSAPLQLEGGEITPNTGGIEFLEAVELPAASSQAAEPFFSLGAALSLLGLLNPYILVLLISVALFLTYLYYRYRKGDAEKLAIEDKAPSQAESEWQNLPRQEEEDKVF